MPVSSFFLNVPKAPRNQQHLKSSSNGAANIFQNNFLISYCIPTYLSTLTVGLGSGPHYPPLAHDNKNPPASSLSPLLTRSSIIISVPAIRQEHPQASLLPQGQPCPTGQPLLRNSNLIISLPFKSSPRLWEENLISSHSLGVLLDGLQLPSTPPPTSSHPQPPPVCSLSLTNHLPMSTCDQVCWQSPDPAMARGALKESCLNFS